MNLSVQARNELIWSGLDDDARRHVNELMHEYGCSLKSAVRIHDGDDLEDVLRKCVVCGRWFEPRSRRSHTMCCSRKCGHSAGARTNHQRCVLARGRRCGRP